MTLDRSALVAVLFSESGYLDLVDRILDADTVRVARSTLRRASARHPDAERPVRLQLP